MGPKMAKKHLTDKSVQYLKPPARGQLEVFDLGYPGLAIRVGHGGAKSFELLYKSGTKMRRETLGRWPAVSLADARMAWRRVAERLLGLRPLAALRAQAAVANARQLR